MGYYIALSIWNHECANSNHALFGRSHSTWPSHWSRVTILTLTRTLTLTHIPTTLYSMSKPKDGRFKGCKVDGLVTCSDHPIQV